MEIDIKKLDEKYAKEILEQCFITDDHELCHILADEILEKLLEKLGMTETLAAYNEVEKYYS